MKQSFLKRALVVTLLVCIVTLLTAVLPAGAVHAATTRTANPAISCPGRTFSPGATWQPGTSFLAVVCSGKTLAFNYQTDGNLVLDCQGYGVIWDTGTGGHPDQADYASFQNDGNLVVYGYNALGWVGVGWASGTNNQGATHMVLQGDGNLVIYNGGNRALWASGTNGHC